MPTKRVKIGFSFLGGPHWIAGVTFLESILKAVNALEKAERPEIALVTNKQMKEEQLCSLLPFVDEVLQIPPPKEHELPIWHEKYRAVKRKLHLPVHPVPTMSSLEPFLLEHGITSFFAKNECEKMSGVNLISWIPDFQHEHLPDFFSSHELRSRRQHFGRIAECANRIAVTSEDVLNDVNRFLPQARPKSVVMPFVTSIPTDCMNQDPGFVVRRYQIPERFIYLPNQFFRHKNHLTVIRALELAVKEVPDITVVCSGNTQDHRQPNYFNEILQEVSARGVRGNFVILGLIPYEHVFALMRQSLSVLQPSNFEGLSMSLAEAKSMGKRVILSDLAVHTEMAPEWALFFNRNDERELADRLIETFRVAKPGPDLELESLMKSRNAKRIQDFGRRFLEIVSDALTPNV
jgi:glycosyltransferase involved in cell wall biosynthesis